MGKQRVLQLGPGGEGAGPRRAGRTLQQQRRGALQAFSVPNLAAEVSAGPAPWGGPGVPPSLPRLPGPSVSNPRHQRYLSFSIIQASWYGEPGPARHPAWGYPHLWGYPGEISALNYNGYMWARVGGGHSNAKSGSALLGVVTTVSDHFLSQPMTHGSHFE